MKSFHKAHTQLYVKELLKDKIELRDDDEKLVANVFFQFLLLGKYDPHKISAFKLLELYAAGEIPTAAYIKRVKYRIQLKHRELRGANWKNKTTLI